MASPKQGKQVSSLKPAKPAEAYEADDADPGQVAKAKAAQRASKSGKYGLQKLKPLKPASGGEAPKKSWIEVKLQDKSGQPIAGEPYRVVLPDGSTAAEGSLDSKGYARVDGIDPGQCKITFPERDGRGWNKKG